MTSGLSSDVHLAGDHVFMPGVRAVMLFDEVAKPSSTPKVKETGSSEMISWGDSNDYPQTVLELVNSSSETLSLLGWLVDIMYGGGLTYEVYDASDEAKKRGTKAYKEIIDAEVDAFIEANNLNEYLLESIIDFIWFQNAFPELIKNKRGDKIVQITSQEACFCRFGKQNSAGYSDKVFINANFPSGKEDDDLTIPVVAIDPYELNKLAFVQQLKDSKFILPINFPSPGKVLYQTPAWHSIFASGWLDVAKAVPIFKKALMKFQMTIKYIIKLPPGFWEQKAKLLDKDWWAISPEERQAMQKDYSKKMNEYLADVENTGKAIIIERNVDPVSKQEIHGFEIVVIDDKLKDGAYLEDSQEASAHIIRSLGLTPAIVGHFTGKGMGAGSGSDARIHFNILQQRLQPRREKILSPLKLIAQYNGWTNRLPGFRWKIKEYALDTLDVNHQTTNAKPTDGKAAE